MVFESAGNLFIMAMTKDKLKSLIYRSILDFFNEPETSIYLSSYPLIVIMKKSEFNGFRPRVYLEDIDCNIWKCYSVTSFGSKRFLGSYSIGEFRFKYDFHRRAYYYLMSCSTLLRVFLLKDYSELKAMISIIRRNI